VPKSAKFQLLHCVFSGNIRNSAQKNKFDNSIQENSGMGKVRGASLRGGNLRGVMRGMRLLVSDFP